MRDIHSRLPRLLAGAAAAVTAGLVLGLPQACGQALAEGAALCAGPLLLSLFPFLIVSALAAECGAGELLGAPLAWVARRMGIADAAAPCRAAGGVLAMGLLGGFAPAASAAAQSVRRGALTPAQTALLLPGCIASGPSFVIVTVGGGLLGSRALGVRLFAAQVLAGWLVCGVLARAARAEKTRRWLLPASKTSVSSQQNQTQPLSLARVVSEAAGRYVSLCGFVLYFRLLTGGGGAALALAAERFPAAGGVCRALARLLACTLEVSAGCAAAAQGRLAVYGCCAALSVQSLSVLMQVGTVCGEVSLRPLLAARLLHLPCSLLLLRLFLPHGAAAVWAAPTVPVPMLRVPPDCALAVFVVLCCAAKGLQEISDKNGKFC